MLDIAAQVTYTRCRGKPKLESSPDDAIAYVIKVASTILGVDLAPVDPTAIPDDAENTGLAVYDILTKVRALFLIMSLVI